MMADDIENWDDIEQNLHPDSDSSEDENDRRGHLQNSALSEKKLAALNSGQELIQKAKQRKTQNRAAESLAKQRHLLSKREEEPQRPLSPLMPPRSRSPQVIRQDLISPRSPRPERAAPTLRRSGERPTPSLVLPDDRRARSPGPVRANTPLPNINIRLSQSMTNLVPTPPPAAPKSPSRSPRIRRKRNSIEELCDQLDDQITVSKSDEYESHLSAPSVPERSRSSDSLMPMDKPKMKLKPIGARPESPGLPSFGSKPVLRPI